MTQKIVVPAKLLRKYIQLVLSLCPLCFENVWSVLEEETQVRVRDRGQPTMPDIVATAIPHFQFHGWNERHGVGKPVMKLLSYPVRFL